ncbi:hypothetical protein A3Q56_06006 [Intoshia linei]|uniref:Uncharacterized protein n=1 Tax=Intoshia linei TaxID=1819745 RepID=A0A177AWA0_9BILA|nr:hypothetical protein A3Q56_06006 [Intoshia linei]
MNSIIIMDFLYELVRLCAEFFDSPIKIDCYSMVIIKENLDALKTMSCPKTWGLLKTLFSAKYWKNALYCMKDINGLLTNLCISINLDHENSEKNTLQKIANCFSEKDQLKPFLHKYHRYDNNDDMHTIIELFERKACVETSAMLNNCSYDELPSHIPFDLKDERIINGVVTATYKVCSPKPYCKAEEIKNTERCMKYLKKMNEMSQDGVHQNVSKNDVKMLNFDFKPKNRFNFQADKWSLDFKFKFPIIDAPKKCKIFNDDNVTNKSIQSFESDNNLSAHIIFIEGKRQIALQKRIEALNRKKQEMMSHFTYEELLEMGIKCEESKDFMKHLYSDEYRKSYLETSKLINQKMCIKYPKRKSDESNVFLSTQIPQKQFKTSMEPLRDLNISPILNSPQKKITTMPLAKNIHKKYTNNEINQKEKKAKILLMKQVKFKELNSKILKKPSNNLTIIETKELNCKIPEKSPNISIPFEPNKLNTVMLEKSSIGLAKIEPTKQAKPKELNCKVSKKSPISLTKIEPNRQKYNQQEIKQKEIEARTRLLKKRNQIKSNIKYTPEEIKKKQISAQLRLRKTQQNTLKF